LLRKPFSVLAEHGFIPKTSTKRRMQNNKKGSQVKEKNPQFKINVFIMRGFRLMRAT